MKYKLIFTTFLLGLSLLMCSCKKIDVPKETPKCIKQKIRQENKNCLKEVYEYTYNGEIVYLFIPENCPDAFSELYNKNCNLVCNPSGGISGNGDGLCEDFYNKASNKKLIWSK